MGYYWCPVLIHTVFYGGCNTTAARNKTVFKISALFLLQIPPAPPRPDFDASREKLQKLGEGEGSMTKEEFTKMKQELEAYVIFVVAFVNYACSNALFFF